MQFAAIEKVLNDFGQTLVADLKAALPASKDKDGSLHGSIKFTVSKMGMPIVFKLNIADYYKYINDGRKPGDKAPPPEIIKQWIINKKITLKEPVKKQEPTRLGHPRKGKSLLGKAETALKSLVYLIGRKIALRGIPSTPFYRNTVIDARFLDLKEKLSEALKQDIKVELSNIKI